MNKFLKLLLVLISIIAVALSVNVLTCSATDSPQYITNILAVDPIGTSMTPVNAVIQPNDNGVDIGIAVTTQVPSGLRVTDQGFTCIAEGAPRINLNMVSNPVATETNSNGSVTYKFRLTLGAPTNVVSPTADFVYFCEVVEVEGQPVVKHESAPLQFTVLTLTATDSPTPTDTSLVTEPATTPTATPTASPEPSPTVPEFPTIAVTLALIALATITIAIMRVRKR